MLRLGPLQGDHESRDPYLHGAVRRLVQERPKVAVLGLA